MIICHFDLNIKIMNSMIWVTSNSTNEIIKSVCMWFRDRTSRENHIIICILLTSIYFSYLILCNVFYFISVIKA